MAKAKIPFTSQAKKGGMNLAAAGQLMSDNKKKPAKGNPYGKVPDDKNTKRK